MTTPKFKGMAHPHTNLKRRNDFAYFFAFVFDEYKIYKTANRLNQKILLIKIKIFVKMFYNNIK